MSKARSQRHNCRCCWDMLRRTSMTSLARPPPLGCWRWPIGYQPALNVFILIGRTEMMITLLKYHCAFFRKRKRHLLVYLFLSGDSVQEAHCSRDGGGAEESSQTVHHRQQQYDQSPLSTGTHTSKKTMHIFPFFRHLKTELFPKPSHIPHRMSCRSIWNTCWTILWGGSWRSTWTSWCRSCTTSMRQAGSLRWRCWPTSFRLSLRWITNKKETHNHNQTKTTDFKAPY